MPLKEKIAEKLLKRTAEKQMDAITKQPGAESDGESGGGQDDSDGEGNKSRWGRFKDKFKKEKKNRSRDTSRSSATSKTSKSSNDEEKDSDDDDEEDRPSDGEEDSGFRRADPDAKFGKTVFNDTDKKGTWNLLVRIIEGKDLPIGALRVRALLDGRHKATRTCTEGVPKWRQNLSFSFKYTTLERLASEELTLNVTTVGKIRERVAATFRVLLSAVLHCENRAVVSKWIALHAPVDDEEEDVRGENCGFLKFSCCVYGATDGPPHMNDDVYSDEVWSGAQLEDHTVRVRLFRLHDLAEQLCKEVSGNKKKKPIQFGIRVNMGKLKMESAAREMVLYSTNDDSMVSYEQELFLPIQWPTVIQKIRFELVMRQGRRRRVLGQASLPMRCLYEAGEDGFMPTYGPAFVNFYGHEKMQKLKWLNEKQPIDDMTGSKYLARLLCAVDSVEYCGESVMAAEMSHGPLNQSRLFEKTNPFNLYCSFQAANMINPIFASRPVSFHLSMGEYGSTGLDVNDYRASTFAAMPDTDKHKYFFMPWGNHRPLAEVCTLYEDVERRITRQNALQKVANMLQELQKEMTRAGGLPAETASLCMEALDHAEELLDRLVRTSKFDELKTTELDRQWEETRRRRVKELLEQTLDNLRWEEEKTPEEAVEKMIRLLGRVQEQVLTLAEEVQISLPAIIIKMIAGEEVVGYAKINPAEIFYHDNDALAGEFCGRVRLIQLKWPSFVNRRNRREESPAIVHCRMWFGPRKLAAEWDEIVRPAEQKSFLEVYVHQRKSKLNREWKQWNGPLYSDEHGSKDMASTALRETYGYDHLGNWVCRGSHDMWICNDVDRPTFVERVYEVERRSGSEWKSDGYTDYYGGEVEIGMKTAPKGWEYLEKWSQDKHVNHGDKHGWVYSLNDQFWGETGTVDREERPAHRYRRRCICRTRRAVSYKRDYEDLANLELGLGPEDKWEYASGFKTAWHSSDIADAAVRRRRFLIEVERNEKLAKSSEQVNFFLPRCYEVHNVTTTWQLRGYLLWAKDLMPVGKDSAHAFVRVTFLTRCQQSIVVTNSQNPIWCETLVFDSIPIPGGRQQIVFNPPMIIVEVRGERPDDSEVGCLSDCTQFSQIFLGRFEIQPTVVCQPSDQRCRPQWSQLRYPKGKTRGAVLAAFELFYMDPRQDNLPLLPMKKAKMPDNYEVPAELKPKFERYAIQFLCWGVRNLKKHKLLSVKKPFVELLIGDTEIYSETIQNTATNPNFPEPLINIQEVSLPAALELAPPMVLNLHDRRAFRREPIVGYCHISDFTRYVFNRRVQRPTKSDKGMAEFESLIEEEAAKLGTIRIRGHLTKDGEPPLDWWSKYYYSQGLTKKSPGFEESGIECITVYKDELEKVNKYNSFTDFLDTFTLFKCARGNFDDPEEKQKTGELKGKLFITRLKDQHVELPDPPGVEFIGVTKCLLRVYVIEARGLVSQRRSGLCDPYLIVRCGKQKKNLKKNYRPDTLEPVFGELVEIEVDIPLEKDLTITLMDKRRLLTDEEIGSTTIDMENRLLTKWRGTVGLPKQYTIHGELPWRDQITPLMALQRYCTKMMIQPAEKLYKGGDYGIRVLGVDVWYAEVRKQWKRDDEQMKNRLERAGAGADESDELEDSTKEKKKLTEEEKEEYLEKQEQEDRKFVANAWGDGPEGEDCRKRATFRQKKDEDLSTKKRFEQKKKQRDEIVGRPYQCVALHILHMMQLVPEHVETRPLHSQLSPNVSSGELRLFVDMFPMGVGVIPAPLDISPRRSDRYQLRVAVLHVSDAIPVKKSFGQPICDLYVRCFINGQQKPDRTDVHFRSEDGKGEFNWRFLLPVDFNPWEQKVMAYRKTRLFRKPREELVEPLMIIQLWDKNTFKKDTLLGEMVFDMTDFNEGLLEPEDVARYTRRRTLLKQGYCSLSRRCCLVRCCCFLKDTRCCLKIRKNRDQPLPKAPRYVHPDEAESLSLFESGTIRGWWPMLSNEVSDKQKEDVDAKKKKDDDYDPDALYVMGLIELEMQLLPLDEAKADPVGRKRKDPNHSPHLPKPKRSKWNLFWFTSRVEPCICWFWHKIGIQILFWIVVILLICLCLWGLVENWPLIMGFMLKWGQKVVD